MTIRRHLVRVATGGAAVAIGATCRAEQALSFVVAQVTVEKGGGKSYLVEILVTLALFGLALWVICKASRRV